MDLHARKIVGWSIADPGRIALALRRGQEVGHLRLQDLIQRFPTAAWVHSSIRYSVAQSASSRSGSAMVLARLSEVLFAEAVRQHMDLLAPEETGWLAALRDRHVGRALALLHEQPAHP